MHGLHRYARTHLALVALLGAASAGCALSDYQAPPTNEGGGGGVSSSNGGSGGGSSSNGSGGGSGGENCLDGIDNDGDSMIDCEDPDCQPGYECVPAQPAGWSKHRRIRTLSSTGAPETCPDGSAPVPLGLQPNTSECTPCDKCKATAFCPPPEVTGFTTTGCGDSKLQLSFILACGDLAGSQSILVGGQNEPQIMGACTPGTSAQVNPESFATRMDVCAVSDAVGGGCDAGNVCVPRTGGTYDTRICVESGQLDTCPEAFAMVQHTVYESANDERKCGECVCDTAKISCDPPTVRLDSGALCDGGSTMTVGLNACHDIVNGGWQAVSSDGGQAKANAGFCSGGQASGAVTPSAPRKFCCTP